MALPRLELWSSPQAAGGSRLAVGGFLPYRTAWSTTRSLINPDSMTFSIPGNSEAATIVRKGHCARLWRSDTDFEEWPVDGVVMNRAANGGSDIDVTCNPIAFLLGTHGLITDPLATPLNGIPATSFGFVGLTLAEMLATYVTTNASVTDVLPWLTLGTIEPTTEFDLDVQDVNTLSLITAALAQLASLGVLAEFSFTRNGTSSYNLNIFNTIGASAPKFFVRVAKNLQTLKRTVDGSQQYSRLTPKLATLNGESTAIGLSRWVVTNIASNVVTLDDPAGGAGPVGFDDQLNGLYVYVEATGSFVLITDSDAANQTVTLTSASGIADDMLVQFRVTNGSPAVVPTSLDWPLYKSTTPPGIGIVAGQIDKSNLQAIPNLAVNGALRQWSDSGALPDGYGANPYGGLGVPTNTPASIAAGGNLDVSQNTDPLFRQLASTSLHFRALQAVLVSPPIKVTPWFAGMPVSVRLRLLLSAGWDPTLNSQNFMRMSLGIQKSDGTIHQWVDDGRVAFVEPGSAIGTPYRNLAGGQFVDIVLEDQDITAPSKLSGVFSPVTSGDISDLSGSALGVVVMLTFAAQMLTGQTLTPIEGYLDSIMVTPGAVPPDNQTEFGEANTAWQATNVGLSLVAKPQESFEIDLHDRARLGIDVDPSAVPTLGGPAVPFDAELGISYTDQRIVEIIENQCVEGDTKLVCSNNNKRLTDLLFQPGQSRSGGTVASSGTGGTTGTGTTGVGSGLTAPVVTLSLDISNVPTAIWTVPPGVVKTFYAWSTSSQPTAADALAGTEIDAPADFTATTSAISSGDTVYITVVGKDTSGQTTPAGTAHISASTPATDMEPMFVEPNAGPFVANNIYNWESGGLAYAPTSGRASGPAWKTRNFESQALSFKSGAGTKEGRCLVWVNLDSLTLDADGQCLLQLENVFDSGALHLVLGLDQSRHVLVYRSDAASDVLLETSTATLPASGRYLLEFGYLIHGSTGYVVARGADISSGTPSAWTVLFRGTGKNTLSSSAGGTPEDIEAFSFGSDALTNTAFQVGGIDDIIMGGFSGFDATGLGVDAWVGDVICLTAFAASDGHYADAPALHWQHLNAAETCGLLSFGRFEATTQKNSFGIATFSNVGSVLAIQPMVVTGKEHTGSAPNLRVGVRSGSTDADNGLDLRPNSGGDWSPAQVDTGALAYARGTFFVNDPATSAPWTKTAAQAAEPFIEQKGSNRLLVTQLGANIIYRPTAGTDGQSGGSCGSRSVPVTPLEWVDLGSINTSGQAIHAQLHRTATAATKGTGDLYSNSSGGADGGRAATYNHSYGGPAFGAAGNVDFILGPLGQSYWLADMPPSNAVGVFERAQCKTGAVWVNLASATLIGDVELFSFFDNNGVRAVSVFLTGARKIRVDNVHGGTFNLVAATSTALSASGLNQVEVELGLDTSLGFVNVWRVDATSSGTRTLIGSASGINTRHTNAKYITAIEYGNSLGTANGDGIIASDFVAASCGTTGGGTGLGGCRAATSFANAVGAHNDSGGPYTKVTDDNGSGGVPDGDYNVLNASAKEDTYKVAAVPGDCATILAAKVDAYISRAFGGSGSDTGRAVAIVGGGEARGPVVTVNIDWPDGIGTSHPGINVEGPLVFTRNLGTGAALAPSDFSGSNAEGGWRTESHNNDSWIRQVTLSVLYAWTH